MKFDSSETPDPAGLAAVDLSNPQSLNRYAYVLNNPLRFTDPLGLFCVWDDGSYDAEDDADTGTRSSCNSAGGTWFEGTNAGWGLGDWSDSGNAALAWWVGQAQNGVVYPFGTSAQNISTIEYVPFGFFNQAYVQNRQNYINRINTPPTANQYISAIANAAPTVCGGGVFGYLGGEAEGPVHAFSGAVAEYDTREGGSVGTLSEIGAGEGVFGGYGWISGPGGTASLAYGGAGIKTPVVSGGAGIVGFSNGAGFFIEGGALGVKGGGGAYVNITTNAGCNHK